MSTFGVLVSKPLILWDFLPKKGFDFMSNKQYNTNTFLKDKLLLQSEETGSKVYGKSYR